MNLIPGLSLRASEEDEIMGIDDAEIGEFAVSSPSFIPEDLETDMIIAVVVRLC